MIISEKNNIILNCSQNEDANNNIYFLFNEPISISYIELKPFSLIQNTTNCAKEIKIFCDSNIIFEGELYNHQPTIILFTNNTNNIKNFDTNFLTKEKTTREGIEHKIDDCYSLIFN